jgi:hypothetical protein
MKKALCLLLAFHFFSALAAEKKAERENDEIVRKSDYTINDRYHAGPYLIFDCRGKYYACVDDVSNDNCSERRKESIELKKKIYPCAPLKKFDDKEKCLYKNYEVVESVAMKRFCYPKL